jgi:hypothetical protein
MKQCLGLMLKGTTSPTWKARLSSCCDCETFIVLLLPNVHHVVFPFVVCYYCCPYIVLLVGFSLEAKKLLGVCNFNRLLHIRYIYIFSQDCVIFV